LGPVLPPNETGPTHNSGPLLTPKIFAIYSPYIITSTNRCVQEGIVRGGFFKQKPTLQFVWLLK